MKGPEAAVDEVVASISETLRPHCRLSEADLRRVSEAVLALGARHALEWAERLPGRDAAARATAPSEALGSWQGRFRVRVS